MDAPFDQTNFGLRERPVSADWNQVQSQIYRSLREVVRSLVSPRASSTSSAMASKAAFLGDGLRVVPNSPAGMSVLVTPGIGFLFDATDVPTDIGATDLEGVDDLSAFKPAVLLSPVQFSVPTAPSSGQGRTDIIEVKIDRRLENATTRRQLDETTKSFLDHSFFKTLAFGLDGRTGVISAGGGNSTAGLSYKVGTAASYPGSGNSGRDGHNVVDPPATSPGYVKIAEVHVNNGTTTITGIHLVDRRPLAGHGGCLPFSASWRLQWNSGSPVATLVHLSAPPSVQVGLFPVGLRGAGTIYVVGGQMLACAGTVTVGYPDNSSHTDRFATTVLGNALAVADAKDNNGVLDNQDTSTPVISVGVNSQFWSVGFTGRMVTSAPVVNNTDAALEDAYVQVSGLISY